MSVAVIGGGVIGLSTACILRERLHSKVEVTLIGEKFENETTSYGAAGSFRVRDLVGSDPDRFKRWIKNSFNHYYGLACSNDASKAGATIFSMYDLFLEKYPPTPLYSNCCFDVTYVSSETLAKLRLPEDCKSGFNFTSTMIEPRFYLPYLRDKFESMGGQIERRRLNSLSELAEEYDIAVNCTGFGAGYLCNDSDIVPIRGQVLRVRAPWIKQGWYRDDPCTYIYPGVNHVILGGSKDFGCDDTSIHDEETKEILRRACRILPSLEGVSVDEVWTGLRPFRKEVRLETDPTSYSLPIVHNYGHGGNGISLSYGTSVEACERVETLLKHLKSKL